MDGFSNSRNGWWIEYPWIVGQLWRTRESDLQAVHDYSSLLAGAEGPPNCDCHRKLAWTTGAKLKQKHLRSRWTCGESCWKKRQKQTLGWAYQLNTNKRGTVQHMFVSKYQGFVLQTTYTYLLHTTTNWNEIIIYIYTPFRPTSMSLLRWRPCERRNDPDHASQSNAPRSSIVNPYLRVQGVFHV